MIANLIRRLVRKLPDKPRTYLTLEPSPEGPGLSRFTPFGRWVYLR